MIPVEKTSKYLRADAIIEMAEDMGLDRPKIVAVEQWDNSRAYVLTFGQQPDIKTLTIDPAWKQDRARDEIVQVMRPAPDTVVIRTDQEGFAINVALQEALSGPAKHILFTDQQPDPPAPRKRKAKHATRA